MESLALVFALDDWLWFGLALWLVAYLPGRWWAKKLKFAGLDSFLASLIMGLVQFTLLQFFFGLLGIRSLAYALMVGLGVFSLWKHGLKKEWPTRDWRISKLSWLVLSLGVLGQSSLVGRSGLSLADGRVLFFEYRDALWHLALIEELAQKMPPLHPGFGGASLTHYHFLTNLFFGSIYKIVPLDQLDYLFRVIPLFLSSLFGLVLISLARHLLKSGETLLLVVTYFTGSLAWVLPLVYAGMPWGDSSFWVSQTFAMLINPPLSLSLSLLGFVAVLLVSLTKKWRWPAELAVALIAGAVVGFKVYGGIVVGAGLIGYGLICLMAGQKRVLRLGILSLAVALLVYLPTNEIKGSAHFLIWSPGWFLRAMVENSDRVYRPRMVLAEEALRGAGSRLGVWRLRTIELIVFLLGNFGVRVFGLLGLRKAVKEWGRPILAFWLTVLAAGVVFPLLYIQRGSVANTIQTFYYALIAADLLLVSFLLKPWPGRRRQLRPALVLALLGLALPTNLKLVWQSALSKPKIVTAQEMVGYQWLRALPREKTLVLVPPTFYHLDALWVGALADKRVVYSDRLMAENTHQPFQEREAEVERFFKDQDSAWRRDYLRKLGVTHLVLVGEERQKFSLQDLPIDKIVENNEMVIYKERADGPAD